LCVLLGIAMHEAAGAGNRGACRKNNPQPKALAALDIFVYVSRVCADFRRKGRCALGPGAVV